MENRKDFDISRHRQHMRDEVPTEDTKYEKFLREFLIAQGYREDADRGGLPFRPDIVLADKKVAIFMHGCFFHRHPGCRRGYDVDPDKYPAWVEKFARNTERDKRQIADLLDYGWRALVVWECGLNAKKRQVIFLPEIVNWIEGEEPFGEIPVEPPLPK